MTVLAARGLAVGYAGRAVVGDIELDVGAGQSLALVGTNGSGKSTLLRTIVGLLPPVAGALEVVDGSPGHAPARVAYLGQFHPTASALPLRAVDVVRMGRYPRHGLVGRLTSADERAVREAMSRLDITALAEAPLRSLSGGQRQRVHLAQVLAREADLLVLDEPTAGLDAAGRERYLQLVADETGRGATVVTATHDIGEALRCDQALLLARRIVASGRPEDVLTPDRLLEAFGIALQAFPHEDHTDVVAPEMPHGHHDHAHGHSHDHSHDQPHDHPHDHPA
ncbi:MAG TPA: metal ABC transporter ATP-binding protein [Acidimicrobiales bacterium]